MRELNDRWAIGPWLNDQGLIGRGVEVGSLLGVFARDILRTWRGEKLYVVDAWRAFEFWVDELGAERREQISRMMKCIDNVYDFGERACVIRECSEEAASLFGDQSLDFVYIDAAHEAKVPRGDGKYFGVEVDVEIWAPKVKPGGYLCGHDYADGPRNKTVYEVKTVVDRYAKSVGADVLVTTNDGKWEPSWFIKIK